MIQTLVQLVKEDCLDVEAVCMVYGRFKITEII